MESTGLLLSTSEEITLLGNIDDSHINYDRWTLFRSLGNVFRIYVDYGEVRSSDVEMKIFMRCSFI